MSLTIIALDDARDQVLALCGICFPSEPVHVAASLQEALSDPSGKDSDYVIAGFQPEARREAFDLLKAQGRVLRTLIHPHTYIDESVVIGEGSQLFEGSYIYMDTVVGENCVLAPFVHLSHDCALGSHSVVQEKSTLGGTCHTGRECLIGAGSVIKEHTDLGNRVSLKENSAVFQNLPDDIRAGGNPARRLRV